MTTQSYPNQTADAKAILETFPARKRSTVANWTLDTIRHHGAKSAPDVLLMVRRIAFERYHSRWATEEDKAFCIQVRDAFVAGNPLAIAYAEYCLWYETLPTADKQRLKNASSEQHRTAYMEGLLPTEKQMNFLQVLGCPTKPKNRAEASQLIEQFKGGRA